MANPWTKKNPFMSMWLSAANSMMGQARGQATAAANRAATTAMTESMKLMTDFWTAALKPPARRPRRRR